MKSTVAGMLLTIGSGVALAQGTVDFVNLNSGAGLNAPIFLNDGTTTPAGSGWMAELLVGRALNQMTMVATTDFLTGPGAGYFHGGTVTIADVGPGESAWCVVRVFSTAYGSFANAFASQSLNTCGASAPFQVVPGGIGVPPTTPAALVGLNSFTLYGLEVFDSPAGQVHPQLGLRLATPGSLSIKWGFLRSGFQYSLEQNHELKPYNWVKVPQAATFDGSEVQVIIPAPSGTTFYRLVAK